MRRPRSLRARLLLALLALTAVVLCALSAAVYAALRADLLQRTDTTLRAVQQRVVQQVRTEQPPNQGLASSARMLGTSEFWLEIRRPDGRRQPLVPGLRDPDAPPPRVPRYGRGPVTVPSEGGGGPDYRLVARQLPYDRGRLIVAVPLTGVDATLRRLLALEAAGTAAGLAALGAAGFWLLRRGLRPLETMAADADAIARGDAPPRVRTPEDGASETVRLGAALNTMLAAQGEALARQEEMAARLRRFVADASHELRTPLSAILGYADLHRQGALSGPAQQARAMDRVGGEALRMRALVEDLLLLARLDTTDEVPARPRERVDVAALARDAVDAAHAVAPDRPLRHDLAPDCAVHGDREQLRRLLDNLLANVRTHTPAGTAATLTVRREGGDVLAEVSDEGPGIPADALPHVLDRFYRADPARSGPGSGLGLAIVAAVAAAHGGGVAVQCPPEGGTRVRVRLAD